MPHALPTTRHMRLSERLATGATLRLADLTAEFDISADTARRDLDALAEAGLARRVRGGAVPLATPARPLRERPDDAPLPPTLLDRAWLRLDSARTLLLDGGTTVLALARHLPYRPGRLVVTPSPHVAAAVHGTGTETVLLSGRLSDQGGIAVGIDTTRQLAAIHADIAVLGACGLDAAAGLTSDDLLEAEVKRAMADAAVATAVVTAAGKIGRRARHATIAAAWIGLLVTDADAETTEAFATAGTDVLR